MFERDQNSIVEGECSESVQIRALKFDQTIRFAGDENAAENWQRRFH